MMRDEEYHYMFLNLSRRQLCVKYYKPCPMYTDIYIYIPNIRNSKLQTATDGSSYSATSHRKETFTVEC